ncbi:MAG: hypothetical protein HY890_07480 [Deltaproteobacteria bacterium]|nr:hypothetical protein [Deltaproteobacteria bacterium]
MLAGQAVSGLVLTAGEEGGLTEAFEEIHEFGLWFIIFHIAARLTGLVLHEIGERRGLLSSMVHGRKYYRGGEA